MTRKALATMGFGDLRPIHETTLPSFQAFADRHGYEVVVGDEDSDGRPQIWSKIVLLRRLVTVYDWVFFVDADAVFLDLSLDPIDLVPDSAFQAMALAPGRSPNAGVWALRRSQRSSAFLEAVWNEPTSIHHRWQEQAAVASLLGFRIERPYGFEDATEWTSETTWLPNEWNSLVLADGLIECRIRHYAGLPNAYRARRLRADLKSVRAELGAGRSTRIEPFLSARLHALMEATIGRPHTGKRARLRNRVKDPLLRWFPWLRRVRRAIFARGTEQGSR